MCIYILHRAVRGTPEAQLVRDSKRSPANHMETSLCKSHDLQFFSITSSSSGYVLLCWLHSILSQQFVTFSSFCVASRRAHRKCSHDVKGLSFQATLSAPFSLISVASLFCSSETVHIIKKKFLLTDTLFSVFSLLSLVSDRATCQPTRSAESWC